MLEILVILMVLDVIEPCFCFVLLVHDVIESYSYLWFLML